MSSSPNVRQKPLLSWLSTLTFFNYYGVEIRNRKVNGSAINYLLYSNMKERHSNVKYSATLISFSVGWSDEGVLQE